MKRPENWTLLPHRIKEALIDKIWSEIEHDPYEGSRAEEIDQLLNGCYDDCEFLTNYQLMQNAYAALTDEQLTAMVREIANHLREQADNLEKWL
jgi:acyl-homoserine lactone acylase PvdQ